MKVLIDTSVFHHAAATRSEWKDNGTKLWGGEIPIQTGWIQTVESGHPISASKGGEQTWYISALAEAFQDGLVEAHTTDALDIERMCEDRARKRSTQLGAASLFQGLKLLGHTTLPNLQISIRADDPKTQLRQEISRQKDQTFRDILAAIDQVRSTEKNSQDAWHLRCTLALGLDTFLTTDTKLIGQIKSIAKQEIRTRLLEAVKLPSTLCDQLKITPHSDAQFERYVVRLTGFPYARR